MGTGRAVRAALGVVAVTGRSMEPTLREGDFLLVRRRGPVRAGDLVVGRLHRLPDVLVVKRAVRPCPGGWELASDNSGAPGAAGGPGDVEAVVVLRYWPLPPRFPGGLRR